MTPRRSRGRRLVLAAAAAVVLVLAGCSEVKNNGQNSLQPKGPQAQKIDDLFIPILIIAIVDRHRDHGRDGRAGGEVPLPARARTRTPSRCTATPASRSAGPSSRRCCSRSSRCRPSQPSSTSPRTPATSALQVTVEGKQWWWEFTLPGGQGRHRERARHPDRPRRLPRPRRLQRQRHHEDLQRDPQLLGPRARGQEGRRPRPDQHPHDQRRQTRHLPRPVRRSTAGSRTPTCASG